RKTETKDGKPEEKVHARHILIGDSDSNPFAPPQSPRDKAKAAVEQDKAKKVLDDIVAHSHVKVPDSYSVKMPEPEQNPQGFPPGMSPAPAPEENSSPEPAKPKGAQPASKAQTKKR
ncbi:MAG TPA: hypothetical protein VLE19_11675, partial [Pyrinomonadaceae bacterium]|nr:hypothetical protein [Pyrinomonadaceae bacterium]